MSLRTDESAVSEIVGALLLVLVVSSAAFGFGLFVHKQSKETQEQKAAQQAKRLEVVTIPALAAAPVDLTDACDGSAPGGSPDGTIDTLSFRIASEHLQPTIVTQLLVNGLMVKQLDVLPGPMVITFPPTTTDFVIEPRQSVVVQLKHVSCPTASGQSPFFEDATIDSAVPLQVELVTGLGNHVETAFVAPDAIIVLDTRGAATTSYILDASRSTSGNEGGFLVQWSWSIVCTASDGDCDPTPWTTSGRIAQASVIGDDAGDVGTSYTITLTVKDNFGRTGTSTFGFTL